MRKLISDYLLINRNVITIDFVKAYMAAFAIAAAIFLQAAMHSAARKLVHEFSTGLLIACVPGLFILALHITASLIFGIRIARVAGVPLSKYVKTDSYQREKKNLFSL
jgi:hypothetical protein